MNARSALFDLFGDHLLTRGGQAPVSALVRLLAPLGVSPSAVRTAVSRMVRQGWLEPVRLPSGPGYRLTPQADRRLASSATRIYRRDLGEWDGTWHLLAVGRPPDRRSRERIAAGLRFLGYAAIGEGSWLSPRGSDEAVPLLADEGVTASSFRCAADGDPAVLAAKAWNLTALAESYRSWLSAAHTIVAEPMAARGDSADGGEGGGDAGGDERAFVVRSRLVHEWRKFLFTDPLLPAELLPPNWAGDQAAQFFAEQSRRLAPGAARFVESCLSGS